MKAGQNDIHPPRWSLHLLRLFVRKDFLEEIEGDMEEVFMDDLEQYTTKKAKRRYHIGVLKLMRPSLVHLLSGTQKLNYIGMWQHNLLITLRGFKRHKTSFLINVIGLSTGLAATLMIFLWVQDERSVDTFHEKDDQLYWIMSNFSINDDVRTWDYTSGRLAEALLQDFPEVEEAVRVGNGFSRPRGVMSFEEAHFEVNGLFASANFFEVMSYDIVIGNPQEVIKDKSSVVIAEWLATSIFGSPEKAMGKTISWENRIFDKEFVVSGIFKAPRSNDSKRFNVVLNYQNLIESIEWADDWKGGYAYTYVVLKQHTNPDDFNKKIANYLDTRLDNNRTALFAQQYSKNYLYGEYEGGMLTGGRIENVRLFTFIAIFILAIACINFMNLSTAQASKKMKEVGVKKAIGANRSALVFQFLSESVLMAIISMAISIGLVFLMLPQFNIITGKTLQFELQEYIGTISLIIIFTGILAGSYPAFYLSGFKPVAVLKGKLTNHGGEAWIRKGLVVVQFSLSIIFIIGVIVINEQIEFTQSKELGYDRTDVITFRDQRIGYNDPKPLINELTKISGVISVANSAGDFLSGDDTNTGFSWQEGDEDDNHLFMAPKVGYNFIETMGLEMVAGRAFSPEFNDDMNKIILNESAVTFMGLKNPVGTKIGDDSEPKEIIGVVADFQYGSLHQKIEPMIMQLQKRGKQFLVKLQPGTEVETLQQIEKAFKTIITKHHFEASFLQDDYTNLYDAENRVANLSNYMAGIAIIISCLGLFGLAAFTAERRTKEIGIRKILGASQLVIIRLLTQTFTKTVLMAILIAMPIGYFLVTDWLQNFAYTIALEWWFFVVAGASALLVTWFTIGFQTLKASLINPAQCLRNE